FIYDACPDDITAHCIARGTGTSNTASIPRVSLSPAHTYYIVVDNNSTLAGVNYIPFSIHVVNTGTGAPLNDDCPVAAGAYDFGLIDALANCGAHSKTG